MGKQASDRVNKLERMLRKVPKKEKKKKKKHEGIHRGGGNEYKYERSFASNRHKL